VVDNVEPWTRESERRPPPAGPHVSLVTRFRFVAGPSFERYTLDVRVRPAAQAFLAGLSGRDVGHKG
jgi:hypothetical protein